MESEWFRFQYWQSNKISLSAKITLIFENFTIYVFTSKIKINWKANCNGSFQFLLIRESNPSYVLDLAFLASRANNFLRDVLCFYFAFLFRIINVGLWIQNIFAWFCRQKYCWKHRPSFILIAYQGSSNTVIYTCSTRLLREDLQCSHISQVKYVNIQEQTRNRSK